MRLPSSALVLAFAIGLACSGGVAHGAGTEDEVVVFTNGDRLSGTIAAKGTVRVRFKTAYGLLVIPREKIEKLIYADGREEVITPPVAPPPPVVRLAIVVAGDTFWQAWSPDASPEDPSLRLAVNLRGESLVAYVDAILDPDDLPGAIVNSFVFSPDRLFVRPAPGVKAAPPLRRGGAVYLAIELPPEAAGPALLDLAYQVNDESSAQPAWHSLTESAAPIDLDVEHETTVRLEQQRGQMEYHRGAMRRVETFHIAAIPIR